MKHSLLVFSTAFVAALLSERASAQLYQSALPSINSYNTSMSIASDTRSAVQAAVSAQNLNAGNAYNAVINNGGNVNDAIRARNAANAAGSQQATAIQAAGSARQMAYDIAERDALSAENARRSMAAIISSNLSSARLGSTANMKGMGIFSSGGTPYSQAIANQAAGLPPTYSPPVNIGGFGSFGSMGIGTINSITTPSYQSIGFGPIGFFSQIKTGTFNTWGGPAVTTMTPPQVSFSNFGIDTNHVSAVPLYGAASVSPFSVGTASAGPVTTIGAAAVNPWAVQAARDLATTGAPDSDTTSGLGGGSLPGSARGFCMGVDCAAPTGPAKPELSLGRDRWSQSLPDYHSDRIDNRLGEAPDFRERDLLEYLADEKRWIDEGVKNKTSPFGRDFDQQLDDLKGDVSIPDPGPIPGPEAHLPIGGWG